MAVSNGGKGKATGSASTGGVSNPAGGGSGSGGGGSSSNTTVNQQQPKTYKPSFDTTKVPLKPGTDHTPDIKQSPAANILPDELMTDRFAAVGTEGNPLVFRETVKKDWQTFGAMHTNQDKEAWDDPKAYDQLYGYTKSTAPYNRLSAPDVGSPPGTPGKDTKAALGLDAAFNDSAVKPLEEYVVLASSQDALFFSGANGVQVPDTYAPGGVAAFDAKEVFNYSADRLEEAVGGLVGTEFIYTNFVSTAIPAEKEFGFGNNIRVLFKMKPGQKAAYVSGNPIGVPGNPGGSSKSISYYNTGEAEMVLPRNQTLRVVAVVPTTAGSSNMYKIDVIVEVVDQPNV